MLEPHRSQVLRRALDRLGLQVLAVQLATPPERIEAWLGGEAMPEVQFQALTRLLDQNDLNAD